MILGSHLTVEQKARVSATSKGRVPWNAGITMTDEQKAGASAARMGHVVSAETRAKMSVANTGKIRTPEMREKQSARQIGGIVLLATLAKMSVAHMGLMHTAETKAKISIARWKGGSRISSAKAHAKRKLLGFNQLNSPFPGCEGHHINPQDVIYMPKVLHRSIWHCLRTGKGVAQMNALAGAFLTEDWT